MVAGYGERMLRKPLAADRIVIMPDDEFLARPHIVAWLGYHAHERFRERALILAQQWALTLTNQPISGRKDDDRRGRIESALWRLEREVDRQLLAGEIFRRQVLNLEYDGGFFGNVSTKSFAKSYSDHSHSAERKPVMRITGTIVTPPDMAEPRNVMRDVWAKRRPCLSLAIGACVGLGERPDLRSLLFGNRTWAIRAIHEAEKFRQFALAQQHPAATAQIEFRLAR